MLCSSHALPPFHARSASPYFEWGRKGEVSNDLLMLKLMDYYSYSFNALASSPKVQQGEALNGTETKTVIVQCKTN